MKEAFINLPIHKIKEAFLSKKITVREYVSLFLKQIQLKNGQLNALLNVFEESALRQAEVFDQNINQYQHLKLLGIPIIIKDNIQVEGEPMTIGGHILEGYKSPYSATIVKKLLEAGAIILGKSSLDEMAMGSTNLTSHFGPVKNPVNLDYVPGGSSGGSAAALAADFAPLALGTDTGGSIRQPASWVGIYGLKPTYGRISRYGVVSFGSSIDCVGFLSRSIEDMALAMEVASGFDPMDFTSSDKPVDPYFDLLAAPIKKGLKIALIEEYSSFMSPEYEQKYSQFLEYLRSEYDAKIETVSIPEVKLTAVFYVMLAYSEAFSNFFRFSGMPYNFRDKKKRKNIFETIVSNRTKGWGKEVKKRLILGNYFLQSDHHYLYLKGQNARLNLEKKIEAIFKSFDFIISPVTSSSAMKIDGVISHKESYNLDKLTSPFNFSGNPSISIPFMTEKETGLPLGLQVIAPFFGEKDLFNLSYSFQQYLNTKICC